MARVTGSMARTGAGGETMVGRDGPYTSASRMPTLAPIWASVSARFTATVDLPTPPLQEETATTWRTRARPPGRPALSPPPPSPSTAGGGGGAALIVTSTEPAHGSAVTAAVAARRNSSLTGHAGVVSSRVNATSPRAVRVNPFTKPALTMSTPRSGSGMVARAARTAAARGSEGWKEGRGGGAGGVGGSG